MAVVVAESRRGLGVVANRRPHILDGSVEVAASEDAKRAGVRPRGVRMRRAIIGTSDQVLFLRVPSFCLFCLFLIGCTGENGFIFLGMFSIFLFRFCPVLGCGPSTTYSSPKSFKSYSILH